MIGALRSPAITSRACRLLLSKIVEPGQATTNPAAESTSQAATIPAFSLKNLSEALKSASASLAIDTALSAASEAPLRSFCLSGTFSSSTGWLRVAVITRIEPGFEIVRGGGELGGEGR